MAKRDVCGNHYDKSFEVTMAGKRHAFDSFACAIHALAPTCPHCGCKIIDTAWKATAGFSAALIARKNRACVRFAIAHSFTEAAK